LGGYLGRRLENNQKELDIKKVELEKTLNLVKLVPNPAKAIEELANEQRKLKEKSVSERELTKIIQELINKSTELGIEITSMRPKEDLATQNENYSGINKAYIEMTIKCPYSALGEYLEKLSEVEILLTLEHIRIKSADQFNEAKKTQKGEEGDVLTTMVLSTYAFIK